MKYNHILILGLILVAGCDKGPVNSPLKPEALRCEYLADPLGIDHQNPLLAWIPETDEVSLRGQKQSAYQVIVASDAKLLDREKPDIWDSGLKESDNTRIIYEGRPLAPLTRYYWKVRIRDGNGEMSGWSDVAFWETGFFSNDDWDGYWIGRDTERDIPPQNINGFCSETGTSPNTTRWVQVDLGESPAFDRLVIHPAHPVENPDGSQSQAIAGYGFPLRFRIDVSDDERFGRFNTVYDKTGEDFPNPGNVPLYVTCPGSKARYVRLTATKLWNSRRGKEPCFLALGELQVFTGENNISAGKKVTASGSSEGYGWSVKNLTDSINLVDEEERNHEALLLRTEREIPKKIRSAIAYISGLGYYELYLNGEKVGDHLLDPGFTNYDKHVLYTGYDVTEYLKRGPNCIGVILGSGWYDAATRDAWGFHSAPWIAPPKMLINIVIDYVDDSREIISGDDTWKISEGPIVFNSVRSGEIYDARLEKKGWNLPGYDDSSWRNAIRVPAPEGRLVSQKLPPIRATDTIKPVSLTEPLHGIYVFDLGVNTAGWVNLKIRGEEGDTVVLFYNEQLNPDGTVLYGPHAWWTYGKYQTDRYVCSGNGEEVYEPRFTYHGFRYVQVSGLKNKPAAGDLTGIFVHTDPEPAGKFSCSNEKINKVQELILRTQLCNIHSIPTDCPHREKIGWMGDGIITMEEAIWNFDMAQFYIKWFNDMLDAQETDGHVPPIIPNPGWIEATSLKNPDGIVPGFSDPWWGGAAILTPWYLYQYYGDRRFLEQGYNSMQAFIGWMEKRSRDLIFRANLADWIEPAVFMPGVKKTSEELVGTAEFFYLSSLVSRIADLLGEPEDAAKYAELAGRIRTRFNDTYFNEKKGYYSEESQSAQVFPLAFGLVPEGKEQQVVQNLLRLISLKNNHLSTGFIGTPFMFRLLSDLGHAGLAYTMATQEDHPGWFYMINSGATTIWEVWDALKQKDHSRNHPAFGAIGAWYYESIAGIRPDPEEPGFRKIIIKPGIMGDLTGAKGSYNSVNGLVSSEWTLDQGRLRLDIEIPVNTTAKVYVPADNPDSVRESDKLPADSESVRYIGNEGGKYIYEVGSGRYSFTSDYMPVSQ